MLLLRPTFPLALNKTPRPWTLTLSHYLSSPWLNELSVWRKDIVLDAGKPDTMLGIVALLLLSRTPPLVSSMLETLKPNLNHPRILLFLPLAPLSMNMSTPSKPLERVSQTFWKSWPPVMKNQPRKLYKSPPPRLCIFKKGGCFNVFFPFSKLCTCSIVQQ